MGLSENQLTEIYKELQQNYVSPYILVILLTGHDFCTKKQIV